MTDTEAKQIADRIRTTALALHGYLKWGHLEKVYENGLAHRLRRGGLEVHQQVAIQVRDEDGSPIGNYVADLLSEDEVIVEIKACESLADIHIAQVLGYLRATGLRHGLLVNFGAPTLQIKKLVL